MSSLRPVATEANDGSAVQTHPESLLLRAAQSGDRSAYGKLVLLYQDRLYNAVLRIVGDPDESADLTQEAFLRGLGSLASFRGESTPYTWLFRIAANLAISQLRKVQRHRVFSLDGQTPGGNGDGDGGEQAASLMDRMSARSAPPPQRLQQREGQEQVLSALGRLNPDDRAILVMRDIEGFDYQQMAHVLDAPIGTIKSRLFRARLALREELKSYFEQGNGR